LIPELSRDMLCLDWFHSIIRVSRVLFSDGVNRNISLWHKFNAQNWEEAERCFYEASRTQHKIVIVRNVLQNIVKIHAISATKSTYDRAC
jgi:hypothetical protein